MEPTAGVPRKREMQPHARLGLSAQSAPLRTSRRAVAGPGAGREGCARGSTPLGFDSAAPVADPAASRGGPHASCALRRLPARAPLRSPEPSAGHGAGRAGRSARGARPGSSDGRGAFNPVRAGLPPAAPSRDPRPRVRAAAFLQLGSPSAQLPGLGGSRVCRAPEEAAAGRLQLLLGTGSPRREERVGALETREGRDGAVNAALEASTA